MARHRSALLASVTFAALVLGACGSGEEPDATGGAPPDGATVTMERSRFEPDEVVVDAGAEVTFENLDSFAHTVTAAEGADANFDSGDLGEDEAFVHRFESAGTFDYFCRIHPTMRATVVVE